MAALSNADRALVVQLIMRNHDQRSLPCGITKAELRAAVNAADDWADTNAGAYNTALPLPARTTLSAAQKGFLLAYVVVRRAGG